MDARDGLTRLAACIVLIGSQPSDSQSDGSQPSDEWLAERESFFQLCQDEKETVDEASDWLLLLDLRRQLSGSKCQSARSWISIRVPSEKYVRMTGCTYVYDGRLVRTYVA